MLEGVHRPNLRVGELEEVKHETAAVRAEKVQEKLEPKRQQRSHVASQRLRGLEASMASGMLADWLDPLCQQRCRREEMESHLKPRRQHHGTIRKSE